MRRSTHGCARGFSILELLVGLGVTGIIAGATLTIALSSRGMLEADRHRTQVNQNLRAGVDLLGIDIRQAGERLPDDMPAVEIQDGAGGAPDTLILRRNQIDYVMPLCKDINAGSNTDVVFVGKKKITGHVPPGCAPVPDDNGDGWPDNIESWRDYRINHGGKVLAYIHNPATQDGEFFVYDAEDNSTFHLHKANGEKWTNGYLMNQNPRIYILEQQRFRLENGVLQSVINEDTASALNLVSFIEDFQIRATMEDGTIQTSLTGADDWTELRSVEVTLAGKSEMRWRDMDRTVTTRFFPRNILSN